MMQVHSMKVGEADFIKKRAGVGLEFRPALSSANQPRQSDDGLVSFAAVVQVTYQHGTPSLARVESYPMVGILNSAPARMPVGQREVTAFCLV